MVKKPQTPGVIFFLIVKNMDLYPLPYSTQCVLRRGYINYFIYNVMCLCKKKPMNFVFRKCVIKIYYNKTVFVCVLEEIACKWTRKKSEMSIAIVRSWMNFVIEERGIEIFETLCSNNRSTRHPDRPSIPLWLGSVCVRIIWSLHSMAARAPALSVIELDVYMSFCSRVCVSVSADYNLLKYLPLIVLLSLNISAIFSSNIFWLMTQF